MPLDQSWITLYYISRCTGCSAAWLAYLHGVQVVGGSNPLIPTRYLKGHEYTECYLYWSCYNDETDARIKDIWLMHYEEELSHLHYAVELLAKYGGKVWQQLFPEGGDFPEPILFKPQKEYVRKVLKSVRLTGKMEDWEEVDKVPEKFRFFSYNRGVLGSAESMASHAVIAKHISKKGEDYRIQDKAHPIPELSARDTDNTEIGRVQGK